MNLHNLETLQRFVELQRKVSTTTKLSPVVQREVQAVLLRFVSLLAVETTIADMIVVIMYHFIIPTKQMKLFLTYSANQLNIFIPVCEKKVETQVYNLPRHYL